MRKYTEALGVYDTVSYSSDVNSWHPLQPEIRVVRTVRRQRSSVFDQDGKQSGRHQGRSEPSVVTRNMEGLGNTGAVVERTDE